MSARKLLPQRACDRRETRDYYGAPHGECHKGVDGRRVAAPVESAARFPSLTENDAMFFVGLRTTNTRFRIIVTLQRRSRYSDQRHSRCSCQYTCWQRIRNREQCIMYTSGVLLPRCGISVPCSDVYSYSYCS